MMEKSESTTEIFKGLVKFREALKQPLKDADNPFFKSKYVPLESVIATIDAAIKKTGLSYMQEVEDEAVNTIITHESGEYVIIKGAKLKPTKQDPQAEGSAITYAKRYSLAAAFGIASDPDDDGNAASEPTKPTPARPKAPVQTKPTPAKPDITVESVKARIVKAGLNGVPDGFLANWNRRVESDPVEVNRLISDYLKSPDFKKEMKRETA